MGHGVEGHCPLHKGLKGTLTHAAPVKKCSCNDTLHLSPIPTLQMFVEVQSSS